METWYFPAVKVKLSRYRYVSAKVERKYSSCSFLASELDGVSGQRHVPAALYPWQRTPGASWTGGWVGTIAGLDTEAWGKILCLCRGTNSGRPVCSETLYWLRYPSSWLPLFELNFWIWFRWSWLQRVNLRNSGPCICLGVKFIRYTRDRPS
jgi:hypothetical protein